MRRSRIMGWLFVGVAGLALLAVAEGVLRLYPDLLPPTAQLRLHWQETDQAIEKVADPTLGFVHEPGQAGEVRHRDLAFRWRTDERGFRNQGQWPDQADIVAVGDSKTFGFGVDDGEDWVARLDQALPEARVLNLAINGSAPQQQVKVLETFADDLDPEVVLFGLFPGNAMGAAAEFQAWLDAGQPEPFTEFRDRPNGTPLWKRAIHWGTEHSRLLLFARAMADRLRTPYAGATVEMDGGEISFAPYIYASHAAGARPGLERFEMVLDAVERAQAMARRQGSDFLVVLFPTKEEVYRAQLDAPAPDMTGPFARALRARDIPFVDLLPVLRQQAAAGERIFLDVDIHPNEEGYATIAQEVLRHLRGQSRWVASNGRESGLRPCAAPAGERGTVARPSYLPAPQVTPAAGVRRCSASRRRGRPRLMPTA